ncbi:MULTISPECIES: polysaccharide biosynthesis/export family protein [unclassified Mucilaginibacter]|uniref:polysaccharide biosynthesis/export family protein n=1 Tax=unclassified Mucilaginibacter TaxID=2617802 RepID=UPI002AC96EB7|nr:MULTISPECIES: polysaccharide biosynthesis/export family protein [unclassified Mucilaginibacter]MEB0260653.1 polysaccharide biosynthesis/export family protein [Mucilaginibacter sp. 10I4]MEB0277462.1 polysaccharide biosynthesis/export family protein [Mucilaginibacter sp. 10B2]MEB0300913.1 polysaccharide biosynthesis/export family protein [Mucilaginibacter sp. 5C4]WPX24908.1 polysaccharide biosynthesis/export family protein [Mucilaginibacter sp. 5C4]
MRALYLIYFVGIVLLGSSCSYKQNQILFEKKASVVDTATSQPVATVSYQIQPQDVLQIRNLQNLKYIVDEAPMSTGISTTTAGQGQTFQVEEDGTVALPAIGHIQVAGLTRTQATKLIEDLYRKNLLKDPIIELKVVNLKVTLLGEVKSPGNFPILKDNTTLVEILGQAGGLTPAANEKNVKIIRGRDKDRKVAEIDLSNINSLSDPRTMLQNGDIIYVAQNKRAIRSENLQSFNTWVQPALLLLNTALIIFTLSRQ